jgi:precorrin-8X/cobalt-precorrin-8 methylmutase
MSSFDYIKNGDEIYQRSFAIIRGEADLRRFNAEEERVAVRAIHACGIPDLAADMAFSAGAAKAGMDALLKGRPILCDSQMVAHGVTRARLPGNNEVVCTLSDSETSRLAASLQTTRSAAAIDLWLNRLAGAVVAIGNAPTALFRLLELLDRGAPMPACVIGMPVGFVGAAESKEALIAFNGAPYIVVRGRRGGSAIAAATVNALASAKE